jgi:hypothetical protein
MRNPTVVLAALADGTHAQVGPALTWDNASALYDALDGQVSGFTRDAEGRSRYNAPKVTHTLNRVPVKFYRMREVQELTHDPRYLGNTNIDMEFGDVPVITDLRHLGARGVQS